MFWDNHSGEFEGCLYRYIIRLLTKSIPSLQDGKTGILNLPLRSGPGCLLFLVSPLVCEHEDFCAHNRLSLRNHLGASLRFLSSFLKKISNPTKIPYLIIVRQAAMLSPEEPVPIREYVLL